MSKTLYIASTNKHKIQELGQMLSGEDFEVRGLEKFQNYISPEETGKTFLENARIKAQALRNFLKSSTSDQRLATGDHFILADDSGLICDDLGGQPGVESARFAGPNATDAENNQKLVESFSEITHWSRSARYVCALVLLKPDGSEIDIEEKCEGRIVLVPAGTLGFGYDPYFYVEEFNKTMAELSPQEKNKISHRGKALRRLLIALKQS